MSTVSQRQRPASERNTLVNALLGAVVTVVFSFVPLSPVLGGMLAGYLQRGTRGEGLRVGALSGLFAAVPFVLFVLFVVSALTAIPVGADGLALGLAGLALAVTLFAFAAVYAVGLGAIGGYLGAYVAAETNIGR